MSTETDRSSVRLTWRQWDALLESGIIDPDGFRDGAAGREWSLPQYLRRASQCSVIRQPNSLHDIVAAHLNGDTVRAGRAGGKTRVLRVLEYIYDDADAMAADIARWSIGATATVTKGHMQIKSATFLPEMET